MAKKVYRSSLLGAAIGDISGSAHEGSRTNVFTTNYKFFTTQSNVTDDTVLTMAIADWLLNKETLPVKDALLKWARKFPHAGYGGGFKSFIKTGESYQSEANGAAMRVSPVAVRAKTIEEAIELAKESAAPTHGGGGAIGAQAIASAVFLAKDGIAKGKSVDGIKAEIKSFVKERFDYNLDLTVDKIRQRSQNYAAQKARFRASGIPSSDYINMSNAALSCPMAIIAILNGNSFEECIRIAISMGGDSDTVGAMCGAIAAQLFGVPDTLVKRSLVYFPTEMLDIINQFEGTSFEPTGIAPPKINHWTEEDYVVYGDAPEGQNGEAGKFETVLSRFNHNPSKGYPIPTVGKSLEEIRIGINSFINYAKSNPGKRFHVRKVGYDKAGYTIQQIAPIFKDAVALKNVLLPEDMLNELKTESE